MKVIGLTALVLFAMLHAIVPNDTCFLALTGQGCCAASRSEGSKLCCIAQCSDADDATATVEVTSGGNSRIDCSALLVIAEEVRQTLPDITVPAYESVPETAFDFERTASHLNILSIAQHPPDTPIFLLIHTILI
jgi:hypothetical protein